MSVTAPDDAFLDVNDAHLRVFGNVHADGLKLGQLEVVTTTSTGSTIQFLHQHTAFTTTSNIEVGTTNHDLFVDTNTSRVGILTNTPTTALDVNGTVRATAFDGDGALLTGIPSSAINGTLSQWTTVTGPKIHYSDGNVGIGIADPLHTLDVVGDINFTGTLREDGNPFVSTPWTIETSPTALSYTGGNVGIGAATPSAKLEVTGNAHVTTDLSVGGTLSINTITAAATHALSAVTAVGASTGDTLQLTNATTGLVTTGNVEVGKELTVTGNVAVDTDTLFVDSVNDRVGVGTTSPDTKFTLYGDDTQDEGGLLMKVVNRVALDNGFTGIGLGGYATTTSPFLQVAKSAIIHERTGYNGTGNLMFCNDGTTDNNDVSNTHARMTITSTGNVGVGTTPSEKLHVHENLPTSGHHIMARIGGDTSSYNTLVFGSIEGRPHIGGHRGDFGAWSDLSLQNDTLIISQSGNIVNVNGTFRIQGYDTKRVLIGYQKYSSSTSVSYGTGTSGYQDAWSVTYTRVHSGSQIYITGDLCLAQAMGATGATSYRAILGRLRVNSGGVDYYSDSVQDWQRIDNSFHEYQRQSCVHFNQQALSGTSTGQTMTIYAQVKEGGKSGTLTSFGLNIWGGRSYIEVFEVMGV